MPASNFRREKIEKVPRSPYLISSLKQLPPAIPISNPWIQKQPKMAIEIPTLTVGSDKNSKQIRITNPKTWISAHKNIQKLGTKWGIFIAAEQRKEQILKSNELRICSQSRAGGGAHFCGNSGGRIEKERTESRGWWVVCFPWAKRVRSIRWNPARIGKLGEAHLFRSLVEHQRCLWYYPKEKRDYAREKNCTRLFGGHSVAFAKLPFTCSTKLNGLDCRGPVSIWYDTVPKKVFI